MKAINILGALIWLIGLCNYAQAQVTLPDNMVEANCTTDAMQQPWDAQVLHSTSNIHCYYVPLVGDIDGDGITEVISGGKTMKVRATACVWSFGADGVESPSRSRGDDVYSWRPDQEVH